MRFSGGGNGDNPATARALDSSVVRCFHADIELFFGARATPMLRTTTLVSVLIGLPGAAFAQTAAPEPKPDTVQVHGKALLLSCPEWTRNTDGSWTNVGPLLVGEETVKEVTLRGAPARPLEQKCANGAPSPAPPAPGRKPPQPMHRHGPTQPADGT